MSNVDVTKRIKEERNISDEITRRKANWTGPVIRRMVYEEVSSRKEQKTIVNSERFKSDSKLEEKRLPKPIGTTDLSLCHGFYKTQKQRQ